MLIDTTLLVNSPEIIKGLLTGEMSRYGSVIRWAKGTENAGQIIKHLAEASGLTKSLIMMPFNPVMGTAELATDLISHGVNIHKLTGIQNSLKGMEQTLSQVMGLTQIAAGASVLNLGVSIAGFAYMGYKLHQIQKSLGHLQTTVDEGFNLVNNRLDQISGQLAYLCLLVEDNREKQESLAKAISNLHKAILLKEIAALNAQLNGLQRFPNESPIESLNVSSRVRLFLANQAMQSTPELDAELMLNTDVSIQGWAVATATEAHLLLEIGQHQEAKQLLAEEVPKFQQVTKTWAKELIGNYNSSLATAYRFTASPFQDHITDERVNRIIQISSNDTHLNQYEIRRRKNEVEVEFEMSYAQERYNSSWLHKQIAIAEYLDTLSELTARLDSLQYFAALCEAKGVKSSKELLPDRNAKPELYLLPSSQES